MLQALSKLFGRPKPEKEMKARVEARWLSNPRVRSRVDEVLGLDLSDSDIKTTVTDPRSVPSHPPFVESGWSEHMILRYLLAMEYGHGKRVLDTCSGLGWGAYMVDAVAAEVVAVELDRPSILLAQSTWENSSVEFIEGNVLSIPLSPATFDVVLCMEAIEHFTPTDAEQYVRELARLCKPGGYLVGSSAFPKKAGRAARLCAQNPHHLHVFTRLEITEMLQGSFGPVEFLSPHYVVARRE